MPIRARLIAPTQLLLEHPMFQPLEDPEFVVLGKKEFERLTTKAYRGFFIMGAIAGLLLAVMIVAIVAK